jgi:Zn-dependent M28 family amino/carboxypeptidase
MTLLVEGRREPVALGRDAILGSRGIQPKSITAPLVFIGYGLHLPEAKYDDFDSPEMPLSSLKGKVVVFINGGPGDLPAALKSFARTAPLEKALADAGAVGSITIPTPKSMDFPWDRVAVNASQPGMRLAADPKDAEVAARHPALASLHHTMFSATFNPAEAEKLFAGTGHTFAELLALADAQKPLPRFDLKKSLTASVTTENTSVESPNIVAKLEGSDASLKNEYVLVSAHLDHLGVSAAPGVGAAAGVGAATGVGVAPGVGAPLDGKTVFAGAMDDASGVASVLEIARSFSQNHARPKRSMLFVIFTGEEKGLQGSRYFAGRPTVPETGIVADFNLDMFMPIFPLKKLHVQGLVESTLAVDARAVGAEHNIEIAVDPEPDRNSFIRTDQYSFVLAGVPALAMKFGWTADSPEYKAWRQWLAQRYHSTEDNLSQPVDRAAAAQFNAFLGDLARRVPTMPAALTTSSRVSSIASRNDASAIHIARNAAFIEPMPLLGSRDLRRLSGRPLPAILFCAKSADDYDSETAILCGHLPVAGRGSSGSAAAREGCREHRALAGLQLVVLVDSRVAEPGEQGYRRRGGGAQEQRRSDAAGRSQWNRGASGRGRARRVQAATDGGYRRRLGAGAREDTPSGALAGSGGERRHRVFGRR